MEVKKNSGKNSLTARTEQGGFKKKKDIIESKLGFQNALTSKFRPSSSRKVRVKRKGHLNGGINHFHPLNAIYPDE